MSPAFKKSVLWIALLGLGLYLFGTLQPQGNDAELQSQFERSLALSQAFHVKLASQAKASSVLDSLLSRERLQRLRTARKADSLRGVGDSLSRVLEGSQTPTDSVVVLLGLVEALRGSDVSLRFAVASLQVEADSVLADRDRWKGLATTAQVTIDSLVASASALRKASRCRVLFVACPSRTTAGIVGLVAGVVGTVLLTR